MVNNLPQDGEITLVSNKKESEYTSAKLLFLLESFHKDIHKIQKDINNLNIPDKTEMIQSGIDFILEKYSLSHNWKISIKDTILTNKLTPPNSIDPIELYIPKWFSKLETSSDYQRAFVESCSMSNQSLPKFHYYYPTISFKYKISLTQFRLWIEDNKEILTDMFSRLGNTPKKPRIKNKTITLGELASTAKSEGKKSFTEIRKYLDKMAEKDVNIEELLKDLGNPDENDYKNAFKALIEQLKRIYPKKNI